LKCTFDAGAGFGRVHGHDLDLGFSRRKLADQRKRRAIDDIFGNTTHVGIDVDADRSGARHRILVFEIDAEPIAVLIA